MSIEIYYRVLQLFYRERGALIVTSTLGPFSAIFLAQTLEDALQEIQSMLERMRELAERAADETLTPQDRAYIQLEIDELKEGIDRIARTTHMHALAVTNADLAASESRIRDADTAKATLESIKLSILIHSGAAIAAQANQLPQRVLSLLK